MLAIYYSWEAHWGRVDATHVRGAICSGFMDAYDGQIVLRTHSYSYCSID